MVNWSLISSLYFLKYSYLSSKSFTLDYSFNKDWDFIHSSWVCSEILDYNYKISEALSLELEIGWGKFWTWFYSFEISDWRFEFSCFKEMISVILSSMFLEWSSVICLMRFLKSSEGFKSLSCGCCFFWDWSWIYWGSYSNKGAGTDFSLMTTLLRIPISTMSFLFSSLSISLSLCAAIKSCFCWSIWTWYS